MSGSVVNCRFVPDPPRGTTSKFTCVLPDGERIKVKYGWTGEIQAEVAASRLLARLGFGSDDMFLVPRVRCYGCPRLPFELSWIADRIHASDAVFRMFPPDRYYEFEWAAVERRFPAAAIETGTSDGWAWYELDRAADADLRAERDALKLAAVLLAHWDNKAANQRLVCLDAGADHPCATPFAFVHDLGATFGPNKVDLGHWRTAPVWALGAPCTVSMRQWPYGGGTFPDAVISERGRRLLLRELETISSDDLCAWLQSARFADVDRWTDAFEDKVQQVRNAGPCPAP